MFMAVTQQLKAHIALNQKGTSPMQSIAFHFDRSSLSPMNFEVCMEKYM